MRQKCLSWRISIIALLLLAFPLVALANADEPYPLEGECDVVPTPIGDAVESVSGVGTSVRSVTLGTGLYIVSLSIYENLFCPTQNMCFDDNFVVAMDSVQARGHEGLFIALASTWSGEVTIDVGRAGSLLASGTQLVSVQAGDKARWEVIFRRV